MNPRPLTAVLRQISPGGIESLEFYPLPTDGCVHLGRDPVCQIVLDSRTYKGVSRQHAQISPAAEEEMAWSICDLNSSNGTYVNGYRIRSEEQLHEGDRISLGKRGPQFIFELLDLNGIPGAGGESLPLSSSEDSLISSGQSSHYTHPFSTGSYRTTPSGDVTFSQLFPIISTGRDLTRKAYLIPGIITVIFVVLMFTSIGNTVAFNTLLGGYLALAAYYFIYQLCGKHKQWWLLIGSGAMTALILLSPLLHGFIFIFRSILPGNLDNPESSGIFVLSLNMLFGAGFMEELIKAIPILIAWAIGQYARSPRYRELIGIKEPLDGILIGTASAVGFTLIETLRIYIPSILDGVVFPSAPINAEVMSLQVLIPRILGSISGHMAYSGYLGYFIGLSALKPQNQWRIILIGYISASVLHALWNTMGFVHPFILAIIGILSYAFLAAAILKARALSPTRSQNFATRFTRFR